MLCIRHVSKIGGMLFFLGLLDQDTCENSSQPYKIASQAGSRAMEESRDTGESSLK